MPGSFSVWFTVCFICYLIRTAFSTLRVGHEKIRENKALVGVIYATMFIL